MRAASVILRFDPRRLGATRVDRLVQRGAPPNTLVSRTSDVELLAKLSRAEALSPGSRELMCRYLDILIESQTRGR